MVMNLTSNYRQTNEQDLVQDLVEEAIEQRGFDVHYIVREQINPDYLFGESSISEFKEFYLMPMFLTSMEHFNGSGDLYDPFGMSVTDAAILQVGARKFMNSLNDKTIPRPREGDLIYIPFSDSIWEITKVKKDQQFYQLGKNYSYQLICKVFNFSHEDVDAGTTTTMSDYATDTVLDNNGLEHLLGIKENDLRDSTPILKNEAAVSKTFDPSDPFAY